MLRKKVVIIGGGFAGSSIARKLENNFKVTLIDSKDYFEFTPSVLRAIVEPKHIKKIQVLHKNYLNRAVIVRGEAKKATKSHVAVSKNKFPYDYLALCCGSQYGFPIKGMDIVFAGRAKELAKYSEKLKKSAKVLIVGGGLVGVELAAEVAEKYQKKNVVIVEGGKDLLGRNPEKAKNYARKFLEKRNTKIILNETVIKKKGSTYTTNEGTKITADIAFMCAGIRPNSAFLGKKISGIADEKGFIIVNKHMQVYGFPRIFAAGDITGIKEEKLAQNSEYQANVVAYNINAIEKRRKMKEYKPKPRVMVISLGKWNGVLVYKNLVLTGLIPGMLKSLIEWKEMLKYKKAGAK